MSLPITLDPEAQAEFDASYDFYEGRQAGLGERFADQVQRVLDRIAANPKLHAAVRGTVRKAVVRQFPFVVLYREEAASVRVLAVFHTSRDPADWHRRA